MIMLPQHEHACFIEGFRSQCSQRYNSRQQKPQAMMHKSHAVDMDNGKLSEDFRNTHFQCASSRSKFRISSLTTNLVQDTLSDDTSARTLLCSSRCQAPSIALQALQAMTFTYPIFAFHVTESQLPQTSLLYRAALCQLPCRQPAFACCYSCAKILLPLLSPS